MIVSGFEGTSLNARTEELILQQGVGGLILFERNFRNPDQLFQLINDLQSLNADNPEIPPLFISVDQEGGRVARLGAPFTQFPPMSCLGQANSNDLTYRFGLGMGKELRAIGINMDYAPVLDVHSNPANPIIGKRSLDTDPEKVARLGVELIRGFYEAGVIPVGKHFPGHGDTSQDSHLTLPRVERTRESLEKTELIPFAQAIQQGLEVIMSAHVVYPAWDSEQPATFSPTIMSELLRNTLQFDGILISDDLEMKAIDQKLESIPVLGTQAGIDLFLICHDLEKVTALQDAMIQDIEAERIPHATIEQSLARIFKVKQRLNILEDFNSDFENILKENQSLAQEMQAFVKE
ncbi:MAG: beta-N-acetylhexosaminidase [Nitrospina sp.]|nr:beta-N-acetylhexosaminidase [Nitrospina sp.]MBT3508572.1 beta-N-acetylhexosaminidase [Nitrospina sp.]MBT3875348.1 beta-N-acetylhexosaminidase [Nitrospina sp.]MBT4048567.1 beta-N-acetylhexosaminidase [Nitrospina sp.]MBT4558995.1 beta-N-acetylhexosaminidase [Nitrospina sp.]